MLTLNQLKAILKAFFLNHGQINSTFYCDDFDFNSERNITYPVANVQYLNSSIANNQTNHSYSIVLADLCKADDSDMEDEIHSDWLQIAEDLYTYLQNYEGFSFNKTSTINKFTDDTGDRASGIVFTITLAVIRPQNRCSTPTQ